jgi:15-cis-phytoene synthase
MSVDLKSSYRYCQELSRRSTSSFYWSFWLLPRSKRLAMCALYSFSRLTDDLGDSDDTVSLRRSALENWRASLERAMKGDEQGWLWPALRDSVERFQIDPAYLQQVIDGVAMDLEPCRYETFEQLQPYCHRVASAVGLACLAIWGYSDSRAIELAMPCGVAMQLTNILRDLKEDADRDRLYLPMEDLRRFGYRWEDLREGRANSAFEQLVQFEIARNEAFFADAETILDCLTTEGRRACALMLGHYHALLVKIKNQPNEILRRRIRLSWRQKMRVLLRALLSNSATDQPAWHHAGRGN